MIHSLTGNDIFCTWMSLKLLVLYVIVCCIRLDGKNTVVLSRRVSPHDNQPQCPGWIEGYLSPCLNSDATIL